MIILEFFPAWDSVLPRLGSLFPFPCFPTLGMFSTIISSGIFSGTFCLLLWDPYNVNAGVFNVVPEVSQALFFFFLILFSIFCSAAMISTVLSSRSFICSSASVTQLLTPSSVSFISVCSLALSGLCEMFLASSSLFSWDPSLSLFWIRFLKGFLNHFI